LEGIVLQLKQVIPEDLHHQRTLDTSDVLFDIVLDRLAKPEYDARILSQFLSDLPDELVFGDTSLPVGLGIELNVKLDVEKTRRVCAVVWPPRLSQDKLHLVKLPDFRLHLFGQTDGLCQTDAIRKCRPGVDRALVELWYKLRTVHRKSDCTSDQNAHKQAHGHFPVVHAGHVDALQRVSE